MSSNRKRAQQMKKANADAASPQPAPADDLDTIYRPELTGRDMDAIGNVMNEVVKVGGIQAAVFVIPLLQKITAPRREALGVVAPKSNGVAVSA